MLALSVLLLSVVAASAVMLKQAQDRAEEALNNSLATLQAYADLEKTTKELRHQLALYAATGDESYRVKAVTLYQKNDDHLVMVQRWQAGENEKGMIVKLQQLSSVVQTGIKNMQPEPDTNKKQQAASKLVSEVLDPEMLVNINQQCELQKQAVQLAQFQDHASRTGWWLLILGCVGAAAGLLAGYSIARRFQKEMLELSVPIRNAAGSLSTIVGPINVSTSSNLEELETSLQGLAHQVTSVVERLQTAEHENVRKDQMAALGQLAAGLAHELRNPLTAIRTLIDAAKSHNDVATLEGRDLDVIDEEITRLNKTLQAFLDYARPPKLEKTQVDLVQLAQKVEQLLSAQAELRTIQIALQTSAEPVVVSGDAEQLRQVLLNLMLNAFDAVGTHGKVTVDVSRSPTAAVLRVCDTGQGVPESIRTRLFEPFVSSKAAGTGLGLTICKSIVEAHGGTIAVENRASGGACFTITLPA